MFFLRVRFGLSGYGYLEQVIHDLSGRIARIKMLTGTNDSHQAESNDVVLICKAQDSGLIAQLDWMEKVRVQHAVILHFSCVYAGFGYYYSAVTPNDPEHLVGLHVGLLSIDAWYCGGQHYSIAAPSSSQYAA